MTRLILVLMFAMMAACAKDAPRDRCDFDGDGDSFDDADLAAVIRAMGSNSKRFDWDNDGYVGGRRLRGDLEGVPAMTNEQVWHQSTAIERCEILKSRLDRMDSQRETPTGAHVDMLELTRLRRIEQAARRVIEKWDFEELMEPLGTCRNRSPSLGALRTALDSEPGR